MRRQLEAAQRSSSETRDEVARLAGELAGKTAQVEQLTSLSLRGDATLQDYMASLKVRLAACRSVCLVCTACDIAETSRLSMMKAC